MSISLITVDLFDQFNELLAATEHEINIISPFIGLQTATILAEWLNKNKKVTCNLITRFYREEFIEQVSSVYGLEKLLQAGANIYAVIDLHSKLYIFDSHSSIIGSANFTHGGFVSNHEISVLFNDEPDISARCIECCNDLLSRLQGVKDAIVTQEWIDEEKENVRKTAPLRKVKTVQYSNGFRRGVVLSKIVKQDQFEDLLNFSNNQSLSGTWLKFEGTGDDRIANNINYLEMKGERKRDLNQSFFPLRPSGIQKGDILFLTLVSYDDKNVPTPIIVGYTETNGYDFSNTANQSDIKEMPWKERFPHYIEFSNGKAINAPIKHGIRLVDLYNTLGKKTYPSLQNKNNVSLKTLHSMHFRRSHIRITKDASDYLTNELNKLFSKHGYIVLG
ncbi:NgoFVII family restriction endonuclease [Paenibacillus frigoriresistens]|uniref:phospholipase D family protein n=1 Tax=Paenibacillus alginolyticus TaxID=59839 RepID=UPI0015660406|nr:phospholipase D family protein [Paenibacillus frigoriresistens]NRF89829.1 NgoFVII family restriction endonuclease [Paenibacillus frigoriresistens]